MIQSNFKFKEINGKLSIDNPLLENSLSSFKYYNKFIGFFLRLFCLAEHFEAKDVKGNIKRWTVSKKQFNYWKSHLPSQEFNLDSRITLLIQSVKDEQIRLNNRVSSDKSQKPLSTNNSSISQEQTEKEITVPKNIEENVSLENSEKIDKIDEIQSAFNQSLINTEESEKEQIVQKKTEEKAIKPLRNGFYNPGRCCFLITAIQCLNAFPETLPKTSKNTKGNALLEIIQKSNERVCSEEEVIEIRAKFASNSGWVPTFSADPKKGADINSTYQFFLDILEMPKFLATPQSNNPEEDGVPLFNSYLSVDIDMDQKLSLSDLISKEIRRSAPLKQKSHDMQRLPYKLEVPESQWSNKTQLYPQIVPICLSRNEDTEHSPIEIPPIIGFFGVTQKYELIACGMVSEKIEHAYAYVKENGKWIKYDNEYSYVCKNEQKVWDEIERHSHLLVYRPMSN